MITLVTGFADGFIGAFDEGDDSGQGGDFLDGDGFGSEDGYEIYFGIGHGGSEGFGNGGGHGWGNGNYTYPYSLILADHDKAS
jgi:hypothetical protein